MSRPSVDELRSQLKSLGYLSHGLERWFSLDPWSSRTFWQELLLLGVKGATLLALFAALPAIAIMLIRNPSAGPWDFVLLGVIYAAAGFVAVLAVIVSTALLLKLRPAAAIDSPRLLNGSAIAASAATVLAMAGWWSRFDRPPAPVEIALGVSSMLLFFITGVIIFSAAFLSFSIHESQRIPRVRQRSRIVPISLGAAVMLLLLFATANSAGLQEDLRAPDQIPVTPASTRVALLGVDGMTWDIFSARAELARALPQRSRVAPLSWRSAPERWASVATGTPPARHGVHAVEGVRLRSSASLLQSVSTWDVVLLHLCEAVGIAERRPLPPTARSRDYVWEIVSKRGVPSAAVNWWASGSASSPTLDSVSQEAIFSEAGHGGGPAATALAIDRLALERLLRLSAGPRPQLAAVYLPAIDIVINRIESDRTAQFGQILGATDAIAAAVRELEARGYRTILIGMPGDRQTGSAVIASSLPINTAAASPDDIAPTILQLLGFPRSEEMTGRSLVDPAVQRSIPSYGTREMKAVDTPIDREYYEKLRSLGYIR